MKLKNKKFSLDEHQRYNVVFSPQNTDKVKSFLKADDTYYLVVDDIYDLLGRVLDSEVTTIYMYDKADLIIDDTPMSADAVKLFKSILAIKGVVHLFVKEMM
mgnify:CR=1 FL=1